MDCVRRAVLLISLFVGSAPAFAQADADIMRRYQFKPPLGSDIVIKVENTTALVFGEDSLRKQWTHAIVLRFERLEGEDYVGTFSLTDVTNVENGGDDINFLIAKAVEGLPYEVKVHDFGMAHEVDWPAIEARVLAQVPEIADDVMTEVVRASLPLIEDKTRAVLRPLDTIGLAYVMPFRRDGAMYDRDDLGALTYFGIENTRMEIIGGLDDADRHILDWLITAETDETREALAAQLRSLAQAMDSQVATRTSDIFDDDIEQGLVAYEDGYAYYDMERGLMTEATMTALIQTDAIAYAARTRATLVRP